MNLLGNHEIVSAAFNCVNLKSTDRKITLLHKLHNAYSQTLLVARGQMILSSSKIKVILFPECLCNIGSCFVGNYITECAVLGGSSGFSS